MVSPQNQRRMSERMKARKVITFETSHVSLAWRSVEVAALIDEAASGAGA